MIIDQSKNPQRNSVPITLRRPPGYNEGEYERNKGTNRRKFKSAGIPYVLIPMHGGQPCVR